jgi:hypothetical protein
MSSVIPAEAGIQKLLILLDSHVRGNDNDTEQTFLKYQILIIELGTIK